MFLRLSQLVSIDFFLFIYFFSSFMIGAYRANPLVMLIFLFVDMRASIERQTSNQGLYDNLPLPTLGNQSVILFTQYTKKKNGFVGIQKKKKIIGIWEF